MSEGRNDNNGRWSGPLLDYLGMAAVLAALVVGFGFATEHFLTATTLRTIANQAPDAMIVATGMTFVLILGGIDLSVGSVIALASAVLGVLMVRYHVPLPLALAGAIAAGLACGLTCGWIVVRWRVPSFIVTLGMMEIARGGAYLVTQSQTQYIGSSIERVAEVSLYGLSLPFMIALGIVAAGQFALSRTVFGRHVLATGASEEAARFSGIDTGWIKRSVFALSGALAGLAAIMQTSRLASADPNAGSGAELQAIAAVVIGGTSLMGGRGSVVGSFFGVLIIGVLGAGLAQAGAREPTKRLITGCVIITAVVLDQYRARQRRAAGV